MTDRAVTNRFPALVFGLTIALSSFLLFQVQPMIGKLILPWFGGSSAVWTTSMLFFQALLLGGYAYAHFLAQRAPQRQAALHLFVLAAALLWTVLSFTQRGTPVTPDPRLKPSAGSFPAGQILLTLVASVGVPYMLLSTTSSLLQAWYRDVRRGASPYAFYALSNAASLLALVSYPLFFEPNLSLRSQALFWSGGFLAYLLLMGICVWMLRHGAGVQAGSDMTPLEGREDPPQAPFAQAREPSATVIPAQPSEPEAAVPVLQKPTLRAQLAWVGLAACSSVLLLATTNHITQDLTSTPFLWVLPLSLYLLSFVLAFHDLQVKLRWAYVLLTLGVLYLGYQVLKEGSNMPVIDQIATNALLLFVICMLCHIQLYAHRPHPRYLTGFYLLVSVGGALGGLFVSLIAPLLFNDFWEFPLGLAASALVAAAAAFEMRGRWMRWLRYPVALTALVLSGYILSTPFQWINTSLYMSRNFYGVLRVRTSTVEDQPSYRLLNGGIMHGSQVMGEDFRMRPTTYYTLSSGVGKAYQRHPRYLSGKPMRVGVVGLGVGTIAAYGRAGDVIRFYEINPGVVDLATQGPYFTYLEDSPAETEIVLGDARLSLEAELVNSGGQGYQLLAVDAFSGDSIPTHLINTEAFALYRAHLSPDGILAMHISNRHINLEPVVAGLAAAYDMDGVVVRGGRQDWQGSYSVWILLGSTEAIHGNPDLEAVGEALQPALSLRLWTDDYSNLLQVLR